MLKNKLGITNQIELADVEEKITKKKILGNTLILIGIFCYYM